MQVLFEREKHASCDAEQALERDSTELGEIDDAFAKTLLEGILHKEHELREAVEAHAPQWPLERMDPISRAILLLGTYELLFNKDAPAAVVMNECIDIAKEFGTAESGKFVNGVLNAIAHRKE